MLLDILQDFNCKFFPHVYDNLKESLVCVYLNFNAKIPDKFIKSQVLKQRAGWVVEKWAKTLKNCKQIDFIEEEEEEQGKKPVKKAVVAYTKLDLTEKMNADYQAIKQAKKWF